MLDHHSHSNNLDQNISVQPSEVGLLHFSKHQQLSSSHASEPEFHESLFLVSLQFQFEFFNHAAVEFFADCKRDHRLTASALARGISSHFFHPYGNWPTRKVLYDFNTQCCHYYCLMIDSRCRQRYLRLVHPREPVLVLQAQNIWCQCRYDWHSVILIHMDYNYTVHVKVNYSV